VRGTNERWELIRSRSAGAKSLLDVGCNAGVLTELAAHAGLTAVGVEANPKILSVAYRRCKPGLALSYVHCVVTPDNVATLPVCDVVLCLSVYHQWHVAFGHDDAQRILETLGSKARRALFFESASQRRKYGSAPPNFIDRDQNSIVQYNLEMLGKLFGRSNVEFVKATPASRGERFRCLFAVQR